jgi:hypothetical protein
MTGKRKPGFGAAAPLVLLVLVYAACGSAGGGPAGSPDTYYTVSYSVGEGGGTAPTAQTVTPGTAITLPGRGAAAHDTLGFGGWESGGVVYQAGTAYPVNGGVTFTAQWIPRLTGTDVGAYFTTNLAADTRGGTADDPIPLPAEITLSTNWEALLTAIKAADKYVALDLYDSGFASGTEFDPNNALTGNAQAGKGKIVSLTLPSAATSIADGTSSDPAFKDFANLTTVSGENVTDIGDYAFSYTGLTSVNLPEATAIGDYAFRSCTALTSVSLPEATAIGDDAFNGCYALASMSLPEAETIGEYAFYNCTALASVSLPEATDIGEFAFYDCTALASVFLPATLTTIYGSSFMGCTSLTSITVAADNNVFSVVSGALIKDGNTLISCPAAAAVTLSNITTVGSYAFANCIALTSVSLPQATDIGREAFYGCTALTSVSLPKAATIDWWAFINTGTTVLTVTLGATPPTVGVEMFAGVTGGTKAVTVRVPSASIGSGTNQYNDTWKIAFRGAGGSSAAAGGGTANPAVDVDFAPL